MVRSVCGFADCRRCSGVRGLSAPCLAICRLTCRFISPRFLVDFARAEVRSVMSRAGGTRTPNRRFWRPVLCQLSYCPSGAGSGQGRIAAASPRPDGATPALSRRGAAQRLRDRAIRSAAVAPAATRRAADRPGVGEPAAGQQRAARALLGRVGERGERLAEQTRASARRSGCAASDERAQQAAVARRARPGSAGTSRCGSTASRSASRSPSTSARQQRGHLFTPHEPRLLLRTARRAACAGPGAAAPSPPRP